MQPIPQKLPERNEGLSEGGKNIPVQQRTLKEATIRCGQSELKDCLRVCYFNKNSNPGEKIPKVLCLCVAKAGSCDGDCPVVSDTSSHLEVFKVATVCVVCVCRCIILVVKYCFWKVISSS